MTDSPSIHRSKEELRKEIAFLKKRIEDLNKELASSRIEEISGTSPVEIKSPAGENDPAVSNDTIVRRIREQIQALKEKSERLGWKPILSDVVRFKEVKGLSGARRLIPLDGETAEETFGYKYPRIQKFLKQAIEFAERRDANPKLTKAALAKEVGLSRYELRHMLKLLHLAPEIRKLILALPPSKKEHPITKRKLRTISMIFSHHDQRDRFCELLSQTMGGKWICEIGKGFKLLDDVDHSSELSVDHSI